MGNKELSSDPSILEAVDNLSSMAELNPEELILEKGEGEKGISLRTSRWLDPKNAEKTEESVKSTLKVVHNYLRHIYTKESKQIKDKEMQGGLKSIVALANEAVKKMDECSQFFKRGTSIKDSKEFKDLIDFYEKKILRKFEETLTSEEKWEEEWSGEEDAADIQRRGLKDLETVTRDRDYELFYITKEDGGRFYNRNLLRHIRLVSDFDQIINNLSGEDPLLRIQTIQDHRACMCAEHIKKATHNKLSAWLQKAGKYREDPFVQTFFRGVMALLLAANAKNRMAHTLGKPSFSYFKDFKFYLRRTLRSIEYHNLIESSEEKVDPIFHKMIELVHEMAFSLFTYQPNCEEGYSLLMRIIGDEEKKGKKSKTSSLSLWNKVLDDYDILYTELQKYPSGPLFKVLDILQEGESLSFDPYMQDDLPEKLYDVHINGKWLTVIDLASPTDQKQIDKAEVIPEFFAVMRHIHETGGKCLMINFQDRTSWKEYARSKALEEWQKTAAVERELDVMTLPKNTDFYLQADEYIKQSVAKDFKKMLLEQVKSEEECGFSFPKAYDRKALHAFCAKAIEIIDALFFGGKETLSRKNRLDFIELFYQFIIFYAAIASHASYLLFTAKDTVDIPSTSISAFFAFTKLLKGETSWKEEEKEFFVSMIFLPALLIRERPVDIRALNRMISMLSVVSGEVEVSHSKIAAQIDPLFGGSFIEGLDIKGIESV